MKPERIVLRIFTALLIASAMWVAGRGLAFAQSSESSESTSATLEAQQIAKWRAFYQRMGERERQRDPDAGRKELEDLLSVDQSAIEPEFRYVYYSTLLGWRLNRGEWEEMLKIRDRLMRPRTGLKDGLEDADLLFKIHYYFLNSIIAPPSDYPLSSDPNERLKQESDYWNKHYFDPKEVERICQYIVDHFDPNYAVVPKALGDLAYCQNLEGRFEASLETYKRLESVDLTKLYSIRRFDGYRMISDGEQLARETSDLKSSLEWLPRSMVLPAERLEPARAQTELDEIERNHPNDPKVLEEIGGWRIRQAFKQDDPAGSIDRIEKIRTRYPDSDLVQEAAEDLSFEAKLSLAHEAGKPLPAMSRAMIGRNRIVTANRADDPGGSIQRLELLKSEYADIPRLQRMIDFYLKAARQELPAARQESETTTASTRQ